MRSVSSALAAWLDTTTIGMRRHLVTLTLADSTVVRWTDHEADIVYGGNTYVAGGTGTAPLLRVGKRSDPAGTGIGDCELVLLCGETARLAGVTIPMAVIHDLLDRATVRIDRVFGSGAIDLTMGAMRLFDGVVAETDVSSTQVTLSLVDPRDELSIELPRTPLQPPCTARLFDTQCGVSKPASTVTATVAGGATGWTVPTDRTEADGHFTLGVLTFSAATTTVALRNVSRAVRAYAQASGAFTVDEELPATPVAGDTFSAHPGCNGSFTDPNGCPKFSNQAHFRGFPLLPAETSDARRKAVFNRDTLKSEISWWNGISANVTPPDLVLPIVYGRRKVTGHVVYRYSVDNRQTTVIVAFCEGPITGTRRCWIGEAFYDQIPLEPGYSRYYPWNTPDVFYLGTRPTQSGWPWLGPAVGGVDPAYAGVHYPGVAIWCAKRRPIAAGTAETYELEVDGFLAGPTGDAHPADIIADPTYGLLTNSAFGAGFRWPVVTDIGPDGTYDSSARRYITASALLLSPVIDARRKTIDILQELLQSCNCSCRVADGALQIVPLGDVPFTGNGVAYTPDTTVQYALTESDFITNGNEDPIVVRRPARETVCNIAPVAWNERNPVIDPRKNSTSYATGAWFSLRASDGKDHAYTVIAGGTSDSTQPSAYAGAWGEEIADGTLHAKEKGIAKDASYAYVTRYVEDPEPVDVARNGPRRADCASLPMICLPDAALTISRLLAQRAVKRRNTYEFKVGWRFARLQPLDYVEISDTRFGLVNQTVRIISVDEDDDVLTVKAEDAPLGMSHAVAHPTQSSDSSFIGQPWLDPDARIHQVSMGTWAKRSVGGANLKALASNGSVFVAAGAGDSNTCLSSPNGATWTTRTLAGGIGTQWYGARWIEDLGLFVLVGDASPSSGLCATSPDAITWTNRTIPGFNYSCVEWNGTIAVALGGGGYAASSPDAITWTARSFPSWGTVHVAYGGGTFCAIGAARDTATSTVGTTWTVHANALPVTATWIGIAHDGQKFVAVGYDSGGAAVCASSVDGVTWTARQIGIPSCGGGGHLIWTGSIFFAWWPNATATSFNGYTWTVRPPLPDIAEATVWSNGLGVAVGGGYAYTSLMV